MNKRRNIRDFLWLVLAVLSIVLLVFAVATPRAVGDTGTAARKVERRLSRRMARLDWFVQHPQKKLPADMVIYTYEDDSLRSWRNKFPLYNDDISSRVVVQRIANPRVNLRSPLSYVTQEPTFMNIGANWYIVRMQEEDGRKVISGLLISSTLDNTTFRGVNPKLHLGHRFSVRPLTFSGGSPVSLGGNPVFKVLYDSLTGVVVANAALLWISLALFLVAAVAFVFRRRTLKRALCSVAGIVVATAAMYFWGRSAQSEFAIFSPMVYAGGSLLFSLGAVLLLNLAILLCAVVMYLVRRNIWEKIRTGRAAVLLSIFDLLLLAALVAYVHLTLSSIISNSNISLELYKLGSLSVFSFVVYASFLSVLAVVPMLLQMLQPAFSRIFGKHIDFFSGPSRSVYSFIAGVYLVVAFAVLGFQKEEGRVEVWAGKLAVDRDITLELQLLKVERPIAEDAVISALAFIDGAEVIIRNRIIDHYLLSESADYSISVQMVHPGLSSPQAISSFERLTSEGVPISNGSFFLCSGTQEGPVRYDGIFTYFHQSGRVAHLVLEVEQKNLPDGKGYSRLLSLVSTNRLNVPSAYSYSRYQERDLRLFKGEYPYSTRMDDWMYDTVYKDRVCHYVRDGFVHFVNVITDNEAVIISRREIGFFSYVVAAVFAALVMFLLLLGLKPKRRGPKGGEHNYFRSWMSWTLMLSLIAAMLVMAGVSVFFVYRRNEANQVSIMSDRINSIQLLAQNGVRGMDLRDLQHSSELVALIQSVSDNTGSDLSVYSTDGRIILSTNPEALDYMLLGYRIDEDALDHITRLHKRYYLKKESLVLRHYHTMYMPLIGPDGSVVAILSAPYVEESYDFERDAVTHSMTIITVFILLFLLARLMESAVLDRVFRPLSLMGRTMSRAGQGALEHISYGRTDEISALVDAYNRMVDELDESTRKLAQAERDKAWHGMARQVAHEIKNPLTPMKLQIQRIMRLKQKGNVAWQDKFDDMCKVLLEHIDVLTETSNEFSSFAKLDTEEHTEINLDLMLQQELSMFDNRDDVEFSYIGLSDAMVMAPKPQLTRVFVNLLTNAVQAVEGRDDARIYVALRKSGTDGYYDIVVEDSGPGVSEENVSKLFTPNFTTKSGGSGLGLAISKSILDRCGATISYSRSFVLGGACFTIRYPAAPAEKNISTQ